MSLLPIASILAAANIVLLVGLIIIWTRSYRTFKTTLSLGLIAFAAVLLLENALAIYFFFSMRMLYAADPLVEQSVLLLRGLQLIALLFLTWVTMR